MKIINFDRDQATEFYSEHKQRETFGRLIDFMTSGPSLALVLKGPDIIRRYRELMPSIRDTYSEGLVENAVHGSDSTESFDREINIILQCK